jgi:hypothetical protein
MSIEANMDNDIERLCVGYFALVCPNTSNHVLLLASVFGLNQPHGRQMSNENDEKEIPDHRYAPTHRAPP